VLHPLEDLEKKGKIKLSRVHVDEQGYVNLDHLRELLQTRPMSLVSLMHANNEIGNLTDIGAVGELCREHGALFHSDTVQTVGHYRHDLQKASTQLHGGRRS
jgi:cysteine desulfurase